MTVQQPDESLRNRLKLSLVNGIGPRLQQQLLERFSDAENILSASSSELQSVPGIGQKIASAIQAAPDDQEIDHLLKQCDEHQIQIISSADAIYPRQLLEIHDPPQLLFMRGDLQPQDSLAIAIVGSRHATRYGITQAEKLAAAISHAGFTVISGLARGIDAAAHRGALKAGGRTLAVLGSGLFEIYPPEHDKLAQEVVDNGALLTENPPHAKPHSGAFPQRNRIVTGLSLGTLVVEAAQRSGALISARHAMEQGREVFAVPGPISSRMSQGCHQLIRDGATLVESVDDILEQLGPLVEPVSDAKGQKVHHPAELQLNELERKVLAAVDAEQTLIDEVIQRCELPINQVLSAISVLEMRQLIRRIGGQYIVRNQ